MQELFADIPNTTLALGLILAVIVMPVVARLRRLLLLSLVIAAFIHLM